MQNKKVYFFKILINVNAIMVFFMIFSVCAIMRDTDGEEIKTYRFFGRWRGPSIEEQATHYIKKAEILLSSDMLNNVLLEKTSNYLGSARRLNPNGKLSRELKEANEKYYYKKVNMLIKKPYTDNIYIEVEHFQEKVTFPRDLLKKIEDWKINFYVKEIENITDHSSYTDDRYADVQTYMRIPRLLGYVHYCELVK